MSQNSTGNPIPDRAPLFSLITVTLNPGDGLKRTIDSIRMQLCDDFEHIIKDGGSTDGSLEKYAIPDKKYNPIVLQKADLGIYDAMNQGLSVARGKYVLFLNAGDQLYDEAVLDQVGVAVTTKVDLGFVYGDYFDEPLQMVIKSPSRLSNFFLYRNTLCHQACFFLRERMDQLGGFDTSLRVLADYDVLIRMMFELKISNYYLAKTLALSMGGGFSANPENAKYALKEAKMLRHRYFKPLGRMLYGFLRSVTLPQLRFKLMRSERLGPLKKIYAGLANRWNR